MSSPNTIAVSPSHLMHACLAYLSAELVTFDRIIALRSRHALRVATPTPAASLVSLPSEVLLEIRSHLTAFVNADLKTATACALIDHEAAVRTSLCPDCLTYNREVFGEDSWGWSNFSGGCDCGQIGSGAVAASPDKKEVVAYKDKHAWLEAHLSGQSPSGVHIWDVVEGVLDEFGCRLSREAPRGRVEVIPVAVGAVEQRVALWRLDAELGLSAGEDDSDAFPSEPPSPSPSKLAPIRRSVKPMTVNLPSVPATECTYTPRFTTIAAAALLAPISFVRKAASKEPVLLAGFVSALAVRVAIGCLMA
ncbi:hypothetical protein PUNSTDRAFT_123974 [Punctularia strigosozonata HHB-11173 SS5]|uniref:uncharacterized protein n=1 Tax=Punctularia strigosozonata (strain HHB-11173) TaxID=741275 RepID=UPI0004418417|nr:uncharacterized protein PUNSTDRAFT_123974 [Punctularia strigosozonata HHB-11173 SS5]EIN14420.1 hypothetical protein PUNSTDRAFT_123974 [Punctularia strigosozonata HHB-11173 SS5]